MCGSSLHPTPRPRSSLEGGGRFSLSRWGCKRPPPSCHLERSRKVSSSTGTACSLRTPLPLGQKHAAPQTAGGASGPRLWTPLARDQERSGYPGRSSKHAKQTPPQGRRTLDRVRGRQDERVYCFSRSTVSPCRCNPLTLVPSPAGRGRLYLLG